MKKNKEKKKISLKDKLFKTIVSNKILSVVIISIVTLLIAGTTTLIIVNRIKLKTIKNTTVEEKTKEVKHTLTLNLKEVSVEEGAEYKITDFIDSILRDDVKLVITEKDGKYLVSEEVIASETTENDVNETTNETVDPKYLEDELVLTYESEDMAKLTEVGEHTIKVKATLGKATAEAEVKLNITAKPEEEPAQATTNTAVRSNSGSSNSGAQTCTRIGVGTEYDVLSKLYPPEEWPYVESDINFNAAFDKELSNVQSAEIWKASKRWKNYGIYKSFGSMNWLFDTCNNVWGFTVDISVPIHETMNSVGADGTMQANPYWSSFQHGEMNVAVMYHLTNKGNSAVFYYNPNNLSWWFTDETRDLGL